MSETRPCIHDLWGTECDERCNWQIPLASWRALEERALAAEARVRALEEALSEALGRA